MDLNKISKMSNETRIKMSIARIGKKHSLETLRKMVDVRMKNGSYKQSKEKKEQKSKALLLFWKDNDKRKKEYSKMLSCKKHPMYNKIVSEETIQKRKDTIRKNGGMPTPWNRGVKMSKEVKLKISKTKTGSIYPNRIMFDIKDINKMKGLYLSGESISKISNLYLCDPCVITRILKEENIKITGMKGRKQTPSAIKKMKESRKGRVLPIKNTSIEIKIQDFLTLLKLDFLTHKYMNIKHGYQCDIFIPKQIKIYENGNILGINQKTIIECDGDYWHGCKDYIILRNSIITDKQQKQIIKDNIRTQELEAAGYKVIRLWEHEIKEMELNDLKIKLEIC